MIFVHDNKDIGMVPRPPSPPCTLLVCHQPKCPFVKDDEFDPHTVQPLDQGCCSCDDLALARLPLMHIPSFGVAERRELAVIDGTTHFVSKHLCAEVVFEKNDHPFVIFERGPKLEGQPFVGLPLADPGGGRVVGEEVVA